MKGMKKNDMGVSPVIAVILMVAITVVLAGVLYLWVSSLADTDDTFTTLSFDAEMHNGPLAATTDDTLTLNLLKGDTITWTNYRVTIDGVLFYDGTATTANAVIAPTTAAVGVKTTFTNVNTETPAVAVLTGGFVTGTSYDIIVVELSSGNTVWKGIVRAAV